MESKHNAGKISPISVAGGYWTGSSAVVDLLSEHNECKVIPGEFSFFSFGQFFEEIFINFNSKKIDIELFNSNLKRMKDFNKSDFRPFRPILRKIFSLIDVYPKSIFNPRSGMKNLLGKEYDLACSKLFAELEAVRDSNLEINQDRIKKFILEVLTRATLYNKSNLKKNIRYGIFDQIIAPPYTNFAKLAIPEMKFINVDRDYRDQYISLRDIFQKMMARNRALGIRPFNENLSIEENFPVDFMVRLRKRIESSKKISLGEKQNDLIWISYEELLLNSESVSKDIFNFLELDFSGWNKNQRFFPKKSSARIGKWKKGKWLKEPYKSELALLEERLGPAQR